MARRVIWSAAALDDIDSIADYIARDSRHHAQRVVDELLVLGESIADHPELGRIVPELDEGQVRERFIYSYRVIYEIKINSVQVLAVIHGKRLIESLEDRLV